MPKFAYNNTKNANTGYMAFKLICGFHPQVFDKKYINSYSKFESADELLLGL